MGPEIAMAASMQRSPQLPAGRRERRKTLTRRELIRAGRRLFSQKGLYEARVEDLTRFAGIAKGTLYQYFETKDELIQAVVADGFDELFRSVVRHTSGAGSLADVAAGVVEGHLRFFAEHPDLMRVLHQARGMLKFNRAEWRPLRRSLDRYLDGVAALLESEPGSRPLSPAQRRELAILLFGSASGTCSVRVAADPSAALAPAPALVRALVAAALACVSTGRAETSARTPGSAFRAGAARPARSP
jgi:AcrR family transcriptional regulator